MKSEGAVLPMNLGDVARRILRRWPHILGTIVLVTAAALALGSALPQRYSSSTTVVVSPLMSDPSVGPGARDTVNIATEREIFQSKEVATRALAKLGQPDTDAAGLLQNTEVVAPEGSQVLRVTVRHSSPQEAARRADAVAESYLDFRREGGVQLAERYIEDIDERLLELNQEPDSLVNREQIRSLAAERRALALFGHDPGRIIAWAAIPDSPSSPGLATFAVAGLAGGIILGMAAALLRDRFDPRVRFPDRFQAIVHSEPVVLDDEGDVESLRWLRRRLLAIDSDTPGPTALSVAVAPSSPETRALLVPGLAAVFRNSGLETDVIHAATHTPAEIDRGWEWSPPKDGVPGGTVLIDLWGLNSRASLAQVARHATIAVLVATPKTRLKAARETWEILSAETTVLPAFVIHEKSRPVARRGKRRSANVMHGEDHLGDAHLPPRPRTHGLKSVGRH